MQAVSYVIFAWAISSFWQEKWFQKIWITNRQCKTNIGLMHPRGESWISFSFLCNFQVLLQPLPLSLNISHHIFRKQSSANMDSSAVIRNKQQNGKRSKIEKKQSLSDSTGKMIELDFVSSDDGFWASYALLRQIWCGKVTKAKVGVPLQGTQQDSWHFFFFLVDTGAPVSCCRNRC